MIDEIEMARRDRLRLWWAVVRYRWWLDWFDVPRRRRAALAAELDGNLREAADAVGVATAIANLGSVRDLARTMAESQRRRSPLSAAAVRATWVFGVLVLWFVMASLYYVHGVLEAEAPAVERSWLFPFLGSTVEVDNQGDDGFSFLVNPGPIVVVVPLLVFAVSARPWRLLGRASVPGSNGNSASLSP